MKLKTPLEIDEGKLSSLEYTKNKMMFMNTNTGFLFLKSFEVERVEETTTVKKWLRKPSTIQQTKIYLTSIELWGWNKDDRHWGTFTEDGVEWIITWYDLIKLRRQYEQTIKEPLEKLGFPITKIKNNNDKED